MANGASEPRWLVVYGSLMRGLPAAALAFADSDQAHADDVPDGPNAPHGPDDTDGAEPADDAGLRGAMGTGYSRRVHAAAGCDLLDRLGAGPGLRRVGPCRVPGVLFDLGAYPALRPAGGARDVVCGELHAIVDPAVLERLDAFEGYDPNDPAGSEYRRERITLLEPPGLVAWIYVYQRSPDPTRRIAAGDWRTHLAQRGDRPHAPPSAGGDRGRNEIGSRDAGRRHEGPEEAA